MPSLLRTAIGFITLILFVVLPLGVFISRSRAKVNVILYWAVLYPSWYLTNSLFHEGAHYLVNVLTGVQVTEVRLISRFWRGDFVDAFVNTGLESPLQAVLGATAPYWTGLIWVALGILLLRKTKRMPMIISTLVLTIFCLRPLADLINNYFAVIAFQFGDFYTTAKAIGTPGMHLLAVSLLALTLSGCIYAVHGAPKPSDNALS